MEKATNDSLKHLVGNYIKTLGANVDLNFIDVSEVTNMDSLFFGSKFNGDISSWDVSNVRSMKEMFMHSDFNGDLS